jgi:hypothetical protein
MIPTVGRDCLVQQFPAEVARPVDPLAEIVSGLVGPNLSFDGAADGGATLVRVSPSPWAHPDSIEYLTGRRSWPTEPDAQWELLKNPLPLPAEHGVFRELRSARRIAPAEVRGPRFESLPASLRSTITRNFRDLVERSNPIFRRVVRRSRRMLEDSGLLKRIVVAIHPSQADELPPDLFAGQGLSMGFAFEQAYAKALEFCEMYAAARPKAGFMKTILLRRIGSSVQAGLNTAAALLKSSEPAALDADTNDDLFREDRAKIPLTPLERSLLEEVRRNLEAVKQGEGSDPKILVILHYLKNLGWLESHESIIFSQYFDTAEWVALALTAAFPKEPIGLYAGHGNSFVYRGGERVFAERELLKPEGQGRRNTIAGCYRRRLRGIEPSTAWQPNERRHAMESLPGSSNQRAAFSVSVNCAT